MSFITVYYIVSSSKYTYNVYDFKTYDFPQDP